MYLVTVVRKYWVCDVITDSKIYILIVWRSWLQ